MRTRTRSCECCSSGLYYGSRRTGGGGPTDPDSQICCGYCTDAIPSVNNSPPATIEATVTISCIGTITVTLTKIHNCDDAEGLTYHYMRNNFIEGSCVGGQSGQCESDEPLITWSELFDFEITVTCLETYRWQVQVAWFTTTEQVAWQLTDTIGGGITQGSSYPLIPDSVCDWEAMMGCDPFYIYARVPILCLGLAVCEHGDGHFATTTCSSCDDGELTVEITL